MATLKKTIGKKPMMKAKNGRSVTGQAPDGSIIETTYRKRGDVKKNTITNSDDNKKQIDRYNRKGELKSSVIGTPNSKGRLTDKDRLSKSTIDQMNMKKRFTANPEDRTLAEDMEMKKRGGAKKPTYKVGGMVNTNSKVNAIKSAGSNGTKVGLNKRVAKPKGKKC